VQRDRNFILNDNYDIIGINPIDGEISMKCEICGKTAQSGHNVSHSKRHTLRRSLPNVHRTKIMVEGEPIKVKICTRCLRTQHKTAS
jgi:large subunit ribosomal protein L28